MSKKKEPRKNKKTSKRWECYDSDGKKIKKESPKAKGCFMAFHKNPNRFVCGKTGYVELVN
jgi:ribosomal protein S27AE